MKNIFSVATLAFFLLGFIAIDAGAASHVKKSKSNLSNNRTAVDTATDCDDTSDGSPCAGASIASGKGSDAGSGVTDAQKHAINTKGTGTGGIVEEQPASTDPTINTTGTGTAGRSKQSEVKANVKSAYTTDAVAPDEGCCPGRCCPPDAQNTAVTEKEAPHFRPERSEVK